MYTLEEAARSAIYMGRPAPWSGQIIYPGQGQVVARPCPSAFYQPAVADDAPAVDYLGMAPERTFGSDAENAIGTAVFVAVVILLVVGIYRLTRAAYRGVRRYQTARRSS